MAKRPQSARAMAARQVRASSKAAERATVCARHGAPVRFGTPEGWHRFRCGCETPLTSAPQSA